MGRLLRSAENPLQDPDGSLGWGQGASLEYGFGFFERQKQITGMYLTQIKTREQELQALAATHLQACERELDQERSALEELKRDLQILQMQLTHPLNRPGKQTG